MKIDWNRVRPWILGRQTGNWTAKIPRTGGKRSLDARILQAAENGWFRRIIAGRRKTCTYLKGHEGNCEWQRLLEGS